MELVLHIRRHQPLLEEFLKGHHLFRISSLETLRVMKYEARVFVRFEGLIDVMFPVLIMILLRKLASEHLVQKRGFSHASVSAYQNPEIREISVEVPLCQPRVHLGADALEILSE